MAIDNKKEQEREELHRAIWAIAETVGILRIMYWATCSIDIYLKI